MKFSHCIWIFVVCGSGLLLWDLSEFPGYVSSKSETIPFDHEKHGENLGIECSKCHPGALAGIRATMPSKADCMDCHNLPLTESPKNQELDRVLPDAQEMPFRSVSLLPRGVVFPHGLHAKAGVGCETCHGSAKEIDSGKRPDVHMEECMACHLGKRNFPPASTDCARCHR